MSPLLMLCVAMVLVSQWLAGRVCVAVLYPGAGLSWRRSLSRALVLGPAALTLQMLVWHLLGLPASLATVLGPWWLAALLWRRAVFVRAGGHPTSPAPAGVRAEGALTLVVLLLAGGALWLALQTPVYTADGMNNFALPARVFATHADLAPERLAALSLPGHLEYPPLVALNSALFLRAAAWASPGDPGTLAVKAGFVLPVLAWMLLALELCCRRLRPVLAVPATLLAVCIPTLFATPTAAMADLHLTAALLLLGVEGTALLRRHGGGPADPGRTGAGWWPCIAAAVACGLTKDEGVAVACLACLPLAWMVLAGRVGPGPGLAGLGLVLTSAWCWRGFVAWHGLEHATALAWPPGGFGAVLDRVPTVLARFASLPWDYAPGGVSPWGLLWPATAAAVALALVAAPRGGRGGLVGPAVALLTQVSLYVGVYALTTQPLDWVLGNSGPRVFMHLMPWLLLLLVAAAAPFGGLPQGPGAGGRAGPDDGARNRT